LRAIAPKPPQQVLLLDPFHAFSDHIKSEGMSEADNRRDEGRGIARSVQRDDELPVDLQFI
jgi:hypothetical protein